MGLKRFLKIQDTLGIVYFLFRIFLINFRLLSGKTVNIIEPFKKAFPEYFKVAVPQKDEFYDILNGFYEAN
jgi:hypothetical protein